MNKKLLTTAIATMMVLSTGVAMADQVEFDGSASYRYRTDSDTINNVKTNTSGSIYRFTLNAKTALNKNLSAYARFAAEGLTHNSTFASDIIEHNGNRFTGTVDEFGFVYNNANFAYKLGTQSATIGGTGLLYDTTGYLGKNNPLSALSITGTTGVTSVSIIAGQENTYGIVDSKVYAAHASFNPVKDLTLGATLAKYDAATDAVQPTRNYYAVDAAYTAGKATYSAEYAKSNASDANKAYDLGVSYAFDDKNSVSVTNYKVEANADIAGMTTFDSGKKGFYYSYNHKFTKSTSASLFYRDMQKVADSSTKNTSLRATVNYNF